MHKNNGSGNNRFNTRRLAACGLLTAADVVLTRLLAINTPIMKIGLGFFAVAVCGALYGPVWAAICGGTADLIGSLLFPTGAYFPGFTLTAALTGVIFGTLLRPFFKPKALAAAAMNSICVSFLANTFMISYITGSPYKELLLARAVQLLVMLPLQAVLLILVLPAVLKRIRKSEKQH